jgi:hypothetical protein
MGVIFGHLNIRTRKMPMPMLLPQSANIYVVSDLENRPSLRRTSDLETNKSDVRSWDNLFGSCKRRQINSFNKSKRFTCNICAADYLNLLRKFNLVIFYHVDLINILCVQDRYLYLSMRSFLSPLQIKDPPNFLQNCQFPPSQCICCWCWCSNLWTICLFCMLLIIGW